MPTIIPGLPDHLKVVPPAPDSPADPAADEKRAAWRAWREAVLADNAAHTRLFAEATGQARSDLIAAELKLCAAHPAYWLTRWGTIFEPRAGKRGGGTKPFIPAAKQVGFLDWLLERAEDEETEESDGVASKSRGVGVSNLLCAFAVWGWRFLPVFTALLMSWKEEFVDSKSAKSLFWKIDRILRALPDWMLPAGYDPFTKPSQYRQDRMIQNPANENQITGETTTTRSARGDRATFIFFDEAAFMPKFLTIWNGSAESTDHRIAVSTESFEEGPDFFNLRTGNEMEVKPALFEFDWWELPTNDDAWVERQKKRYASDPAAFERELRRDPHKGVTSWIYPVFWEYPERYAPRADIAYNPFAGELYGGFDPGFGDESAMVWVQHDAVSNWWNVLDAYQNKGMVADFYASVIKGEFESGEWRYDDEAHRVMAWTATLGKTKWWGDTYGDNQHGATHDTVYTRLARHGILVNRRRFNLKEETATLKAARTYKGRHEALRDYSPRVRFADTPGARLALKALQYHKKQDDKGMSRTTEAEAPEHDWTSHLCSALEFVFVNVKLRQLRDLGGGNGYALPNAARMGHLPVPNTVRAAR